MERKGMSLLSGNLAPDLFKEDGPSNGALYLGSALDCPGYAAVSGEERPVMVLGKFNAKIVDPVVANEELIVMGWKLGQERRKYFAGTALFDQSGKLKASCPGNLDQSCNSHSTFLVNHRGHQN